VDEVLEALESDDFWEADEPPSETAWLMPTGGTSGRKKIAVLGHSQLQYVIANFLAEVCPGLDESDRALVCTPLAHAAGVHHLVCVARGAATVISEATDADGLARALNAQRITNFFVVPSLARRMESSVRDSPERAMMNIKFVLLAGEPCPDLLMHALAETLNGAEVIQYYGLVEVPGCITVRSTVRSPRATGVGRIRIGIDLGFLDEEGTTISPVPHGHEGIIAVRGPAVFAGYLNSPDDGFRDGWFVTGDRGTILANGCLLLKGRSSRAFKSGGMSVYPEAIEALVSESLGIPIAIVPLADAKLGFRAYCYVEGRDVELVSAVRLFMLDHLAKYEVPREFKLVEEFPRTALGKISFSTLGEQGVGGNNG
jgi:acyl-CoA synthetase (AMP-forming)/AMP-acid ligase II